MDIQGLPNAERKIFKEYLLKGLVIFIAIVLGFFAENLRVNFRNGEKGFEYMRSFLSDLKADTAKIGQYLNYYNNSVSNYTFLLSCLDKPIQHDSLYLSKFYASALYTISRNEVLFTNRVVNQLKSSGDFHLIANTEMAKQILDYDNGIAAITYQSGVVDHFTEECVKSAQQIINFKVYAARLLKGQNHIDHQTDLIGSNPNTLQQYRNAIYMKAGVERGYAKLIEEQKKKSVNLMKLIKKEYNIRDEKEETASAN